MHGSSCASVSLPKEEMYLLTCSTALLCALCSPSLVFNWAVPCSMNSFKLLIWDMHWCCHAQCGQNSFTFLYHRHHNTITLNLPLLHLLSFTPNRCTQAHTFFKMKKHEASMTSADSNPSKRLLCSYTNIQAPSFCKINFIKTKTTHYVDL